MRWNCAPPMSDAWTEPVSPLGWERINVSGDYLQLALSKAGTDNLRLLRRSMSA
jgi:hypothetical protein